MSAERRKVRQGPTKLDNWAHSCPHSATHKSTASGLEWWNFLKDSWARRSSDLKAALLAAKSGKVSYPARWRSPHILHERRPVFNKAYLKTKNKSAYFSVWNELHAFGPNPCGQPTFCHYTSCPGPHRPPHWGLCPLSEDKKQKPTNAFSAVKT